MIAVDNSPLLNLNRPPVNTVGFTPSVIFAYDAEAEELTLTSDSTTYPSTDTLKAINYRVHDQKGGTAYAHENVGVTADTTVDVSDLDLTGPLTAYATIVTTLGCVSDGSATGINATNASGSLGSWTKDQFTTAVG